MGCVSKKGGGGGACENVCVCHVCVCAYVAIQMCTAATDKTS